MPALTSFGSYRSLQNVTFCSLRARSKAANGTGAANPTGSSEFPNTRICATLTRFLAKRPEYLAKYRSKPDDADDHDDVYP